MAPTSTSPILPKMVPLAEHNPTPSRHLLWTRLLLRDAYVQSLSRNIGCLNLLRHQGPSQTTHHQRPLSNRFLSRNRARRLLRLPLSPLGDHQCLALSIHNGWQHSRLLSKALSAHTAINKQCPVLMAFVWRPLGLAGLRRCGCAGCGSAEHSIPDKPDRQHDQHQHCNQCRQ